MSKPQRPKRRSKRRFSKRQLEGYLLQYDLAEYQRMANMMKEATKLCERRKVGYIA